MINAGDAVYRAVPFGEYLVVSSLAAGIATLKGGERVQVTELEACPDVMVVKDIKDCPACDEELCTYHEQFLCYDCGGLFTCAEWC